MADEVRVLPAALLRAYGTTQPTVPVSRSYTPAVGRHQFQFTGPGRIVGTVKEKGQPSSPVARKVVLTDQVTHIPLRETWSDPLTGAYEFTQLAMGRKYVAISYDHEGDFRAVIADSLVPTP